MRFGLLLLLVIFACAPSAHASSITDSWSVTGTGISGSGTITLTTTANPAVDDITGITGFFSTTGGGGFSGPITGLNPGSYSSTAPTTSLLATYDNLFYPSGSAPVCFGGTSGPANVLDVCGVDFLVTGGYEVNIFGMDNTNGYQLTDGQQSGRFFEASHPVSFSAIPEPSSSLLLGTGLGLTVIRFRKVAARLRF